MGDTGDKVILYAAQADAVLKAILYKQIMR